MGTTFNDCQLISWVLIHHLYMVQIETWCYHQNQERISIIKSWHQERHSAIDENKLNCHTIRYRFDIWEPSNTASVW